MIKYNGENIRHFTQMNLKTIFKNLELDEKEIEVFTASMRLGESHIIPIANIVKIPRNTAVYTLENLADKGLVEIIERNHRRVYIPKSPSDLVILLKQRKSKIDQNLSLLQNALPELNKLFAAPRFEPRVRIYRGQDEIREIYEEMLDASTGEILYVGEYDKIAEVLGVRYLKNWIKRRVAKKIKTVSIRVKSAELSEPIFKSPKETLREIRYLPEGFDSPGHISIYGDRVAVITTAKENFGIVTISPEYRTIMTSWFQELWKISKK